MSDFDKAMAVITAENDQDLAECDAWWAQASPKEKMAVYEYTQREFDDPVMEVVSRFAQLAFCEAFTRNMVKK